MAINVVSGGSFKPGIPKGVMQGGAWKEPKKVWALQGGAWKLAWEAAPVAEPPYLYSHEVTYAAGWVSDITLLDGSAPGDPEEAYMFTCAQLPQNNGYKGRNFTLTWPANAYAGLDCTVQDLSNIAGKERKTITFKIAPRA
jgi:hypothetical protein